MQKRGDSQDERREVGVHLPSEVSLGTGSFYSFDMLDTGLQGILGFDFFDRYMVCVDFLNKKFSLKSIDFRGIRLWGLEG